MERQDLWMIFLTPFAAIAIIWAMGTGECKRVGEGTYKECAIENIEHFGDKKLLYEDHLRALKGEK